MFFQRDGDEVKKLFNKNTIKVFHIHFSAIISGFIEGGRGEPSQVDKPKPPSLILYLKAINLDLSYVSPCELNKPFSVFN